MNLDDPSAGRRRSTMEVLIPRCCGLDVHQATVVASVRILGPTGDVTQATRTFGTMTRELEALAAWLRELAITDVAMEATGVLWKPVWHVLEPAYRLLLVNPQHLKRVPGRKSDVQDAEWIAQLLQCGLLRGSFVPPAALRELRDLTRTRITLEDETTAVVNRLHKVLEDANLKLSVVASDILGVSGRAMLRAIIDGETDPARLAALARGRLRSKQAALTEALRGRITPHHRFLLDRLLTQVTFLEAEIAQFDHRIAELTAPFAAALRRLDQIPGIDRRTAENLIAEVGPDMTPFPSAAHLASWAGVCPGKRESAGKSRPAPVRRGNRWLTRTLAQSAWASRNKKHAYLAAQFRRIAARRGAKRAIIAVAHSILVAVYVILRDEVDYRDLGAAHFDRDTPERATRQFVKRLEKLGHKVTLEPAAA
jgi:transposase